MERTVRQIESVEEVWETTGHGMIFVNVIGVDGKERSVSVGGKPGQKLRISEYDRIRNQEKVMDPDADVFTNGMLIRTDGEQMSSQALTSEQIAEVFLSTGAEFKAKVSELNEYNVRRMRELATDLDATNSQIETLDQQIASRWPIGGEMPIYRELKSIGEVASPSQ